MNKLLIALIVLSFLISGCITTPENGQGPETNGTVPDKIPDKTLEKSVMDEFLDSFYEPDEFKVKYELIGTDGQKAVMAIYAKGNRIRVDFYPEDESQSAGFTRKFFIPEGSFGCKETLAGDECTEIFQERLLVVDFDEFFGIRAEDIRQHPENYSFTALGNKTILGENTTCYQAETPSDFSSGLVEIEYCLAKGLFFSLDYKAKGFRDQMMLIEYSFSVPDSDLELPAEPENF